VALYGSLIASRFVPGVHISLAISIGLMLVIVALTPLLDRRLRQQD
jgi:hypothetical protein